MKRAASPFVPLTHTQRWHAHRHSTGTGHVYQGRFKSFPVQEDEHFHAVCRYVERNALRANLVARAEDWRWSSLYRWKYGTALEKWLFSTWSLPRRPGWIDHVNTPQTDAELGALRRSVQRGCPYGDSTWSEKMVQKLGLESILRPRGRPKKQDNGSSFPHVIGNSRRKSARFLKECERRRKASDEYIGLLLETVEKTGCNSLYQRDLHLASPPRHNRQ